MLLDRALVTSGSVKLRLLARFSYDCNTFRHCAIAIACHTHIRHSGIAKTTALHDTATFGVSLMTRFFHKRDSNLPNALLAARLHCDVLHHRCCQNFKRSIRGVVPLRHLRHVPPQTVLRLWLIVYRTELTVSYCA